METVLKIKELCKCENPGSRESGLEIRKLMIKEFEKGNTVVLDFDGIDIITQGFGDELVGVFVKFHDVDFVRKNIKAINMTEFVRNTLNWVVSIRKKEKAGKV